MVKNISPVRWEIAQKAESLYWNGVIRDPEEFLRILHEKYVFLNKIKKAKTHVFEINHPDGKILEVGTGPLGIGVASLLEEQDKWKISGVDPLPRVTATQLPKYLEDCFFELTKRLAYYIQKPVEEYDNSANTYNLAICYNVLDHVNNPLAILNNIKKLLIPNGYLLLGLDTLCLLSKYRQKIFYKKYYDQAHSYRFSVWDMQNIIKKAGFEIIWFERSSAEIMKRLCSKARRLTAICRKPLEVI